MESHGRKRAAGLTLGFGLGLLLAGMITVLLLELRSGSVADPQTEGAAAPRVVHAPPTTPGLPPAGEAVESSLAHGTQHWWVPLSAGQALQATVVQEDQDVVVELVHRNGEVLLRVDQPIGGWGPEPVCFVAPPDFEGEPPGLALRIRPYREDALPAAGRFRLRVEHLGAVRPEDHACAEALAVTARLTRRFRSEGGVNSEVMALAGRARAAWARVDRPFEEAVAWAEMGAVAARLEDLPAEVRYRERAVATLDRLDEDQPWVRRFRALALNDLGLAHRAAGDLQSAETAFTTARKLYREMGDTQGQATVLNNLALLARARGRIHQARDAYREVLRIARQLSPPSSGLEATAWLNLASAESTLGRYLEALDALAMASGLFQESGDLDGRARALLLTGWVHTLAGDEGQALGVFRQALELAVAGDQRALEAAVRDRMGTALRGLGRLAEARDSYQRALELAEETGRRPDRAHTLANLGWLEVEARQPWDALRHLRDARRLMETLEDPDGLSYVLTGLAQAERQLGRPERALEPMAAAVELMELQRSVARARGQRLVGVPLWPDYQELYVDLLMELHALEPSRGFDLRAFEVAELARARFFYESLQDARAEVDRIDDPALVAEERRLQDQLERQEKTWVETRLARGPAEELAEQERALRATLTHLEEIAARRRAQGLQGASSPEPTPVGVAEVQSFLEPDVTFLSLRLGEERSFAFVVTHDSYHAEVLPGRGDIEPLARAAYRSFQMSMGLSLQAHRVRHRLSALLLAPVAAHLEGRRLVLAVDGFLHYLPMAALPWPVAAPQTILPAVADGEPEELLLDRFAVVTVPSATVAATLAREPASWAMPSHLLVLGDPVYPPGGPLPRLPHSRREAETIRKIAGEERVRLALGARARPQLLRQPESHDWLAAGPSVLHFASHALIDEVQPELSRISLSGGPAEGALAVHEISRLDLPAELVVLSGCRTALGESVRGEGLVGLNQAFFVAGAPRLLVSLWPVDDEATSVLMGHFYRRLYDGLKPAAALASAQDQMRRDSRWQARRYWAGFSLQGDWR